MSNQEQANNDNLDSSCTGLKDTPEQDRLQKAVSMQPTKFSF